MKRAWKLFHCAPLPPFEAKAYIYHSFARMCTKRVKKKQIISDMQAKPPCCALVCHQRFVVWCEYIDIVMTTHHSEAQWWGFLCNDYIIHSAELALVVYTRHPVASCLCSSVLYLYYYPMSCWASCWECRASCHWFHWLQFFNERHNSFLRHCRVAYSVVPQTVWTVTPWWSLDREFALDKYAVHGAAQLWIICSCLLVCWLNQGWPTVVCVQL